MARPQRIYRRTETGGRALQSDQSGLPPAYREILRLLDGVAYAEDVLTGMRGFSEKQVLDWLDELDTLCFVESLPLTSGAESSSKLPRAA
jgi:hypothetical protein